MARRKKSKLNIFLVLVFLVYLAAFIYFVFFAEEKGRTNDVHEFCYNLKPLQEIRRYIEYRAMIGIPVVIINLVGNIVAFVPFGFLVPMISPKERRTGMIFLLSLELSLVIEVIQLFTYVGSFDVDDLILNTLGGLIGYWGYKAMRSLGRKIAE